ncbi:MAG: acyltransferase family protein [Epulopiscium sp.]|nr:acyltransferase family protein [Candidatus Epulonipiscium sp.]
MGSISFIFIYKIFPYPATLFYWYFIIVWLGLWIGCNYPQWLQIIDKYFKIIFLTALGFMGGYLKICFDIELGRPINTFTYQMIWYGYVFFASIIVLKLSRIIVLKNNGIKLLLDKMGKYSFSIYLIHPFFVTVIKDVVRTNHPVLLMLFTIIAALFIIIASIFIAKLLQKMKTVILFGDQYNIEHRV